MGGDLEPNALASGVLKIADRMPKNPRLAPSAHIVPSLPTKASNTSNLSNSSNFSVIFFREP
jgi:hypothetical protein